MVDVPVFRGISKIRNMTEKKPQFILLLEIEKWNFTNYRGI